MPSDRIGGCGEDSVAKTRPEKVPVATLHYSKYHLLYRVAAINPEFFSSFKLHNTAENHQILLK